MVNVTVPVVLYQFTVAELLVCLSTASFGSIDVIAPQNPSSVIFDLLATSFDGTAVDVVVTVVLPHFALSFFLLPVVFGETDTFSGIRFPSLSRSSVTEYSTPDRGHFSCA
jgi:hypothetical protein